MKLLITGAAGFIGSNFVHLVREKSPDSQLTLLDSLTYAGNLQNLEGVIGSPGITFVHGSITNESLVKSIFNDYQPDAIINFAAETHVDRSVHGSSEDFVSTNVNGTHVLLEAARKMSVKRFIQISTDEVYGSLEVDSKERFTEDSPLKPNSPYSASKAAADLLCRSYFETYGTPVIVTRCTNNYGPFQYPEKVIPYWISLAFLNKKIPIYGDGRNVRDWIHVKDHVRAIWSILEKGTPGEVYNIGVGNEWSNLDLAKLLLKEMGLGVDRIRYVTDRPGHDLRYAVDAGKLFMEIGFSPNYPRGKFEEGLRQTISWYGSQSQWVDSIRARDGELNKHIEPESKGKMFVFGSGFLGKQYQQYFATHGWEVQGMDKDEVDIRDPAQVVRVLEESKPDVVLNAVAMTDIDWCEENKGEAIHVNTIGADNIGAACADQGLYLVHISSGCVQESPTAQAVHSEDDEVSPVCFYSWTKVFADNLLMDRARRGNLRVLILRPRQLLSAVLSPRNALAKMLSYSKFIDTDNSCTVVDDLLEVTDKLIDSKQTGLYNVVNRGVISPYKIAHILKEIIQPEMDVEPILKSELNSMTLAERIDSVLSTEKLNAHGIELPPIDIRVREVVLQLKENLGTEAGRDVMGRVMQDTRNKLSLRERVRA